MIKKKIIMKNIFLYALVIISAILTSCGESFIDRPSLSGATVSNYYNTADEVRAATSTLYSGLAWSGYENRALDAIGEVLSGNEYSSGSDDVPFRQMTVAATSVRLQDSWKSLYKIGGWTSSLIATLEQKKADGGDATILDPAIAECHFLRGVVYFYIARIWGDAPIVTDPGAIALTGNFNIPRYYKADVMRFALEELQLAEAGLPETDVPGRVTTWSAKGMMAKLYLYNKDYVNARDYAWEVMESGVYGLFEGEYADMFNSSANNNNWESLFSVQHQCTGNPWGSGNQLECDRAPSNMQTDQASAWELFRPSIDIMSAYEPGDKRRAGSMMEHGWTKPEWIPQKLPQDDGSFTVNDAAYNAFMANGYVYDTIQSTSQGGAQNGSRSNIAKYVVGPGSSYGGETVLGMNTGINFMVLRYADILLIYAEAVLGVEGITGSTDDVDAIKAFNDVRTRAGLGTKDEITLADIMQERRVEFAFEGDYWYDITRQGYTKAKEIIEAQNRGTVGNSPTWSVPFYVTNFTESMMQLPIPASEALQDPALNEDPVPYYN